MSDSVVSGHSKSHYAYILFGRVPEYRSFCIHTPNYTSTSLRLKCEQWYGPDRHIRRATWKGQYHFIQTMYRRCLHSKKSNIVLFIQMYHCVINTSHFRTNTTCCDTCVINKRCYYPNGGKICNIVQLHSQLASLHNNWGLWLGYIQAKVLGVRRKVYWSISCNLVMKH